jgi:hypothetical protein
VGVGGGLPSSHQPPGRLAFERAEGGGKPVRAAAQAPIGQYRRLWQPLAPLIAAQLVIRPFALCVEGMCSCLFKDGFPCTPSSAWSKALAVVRGWCWLLLVLVVAGVGVLLLGVGVGWA